MNSVQFGAMNIKDMKPGTKVKYTRKANADLEIVKEPIKDSRSPNRRYEVRVMVNNDPTDIEKVRVHANMAGDVAEFTAIKSAEEAGTIPKDSDRIVQKGLPVDELKFETRVRSHYSGEEYIIADDPVEFEPNREEGSPVKDFDQGFKLTLIKPEDLKQGKDDAAQTVKYYARDGVIQSLDLLSKPD